MIHCPGFCDDCMQGCVYQDFCNREDQLIVRVKELEALVRQCAAALELAATPFNNDWKVVQEAQRAIALARIPAEAK